MRNILLAQYWNICLLKDSPENTPYSISQTFFSGALLALIMVIEWNFSAITVSSDWGSALFTGACLIISYVIYTYLVLFVRGHVSRLIQTLNALFYTSIIIHILVVPLLLLGPYLAHAYAKNPILLFLGIVYLFLSIGISIWQFVITAHIYKYALNTTPLQSVLTAFGLIAVNILTVSSLK